ncbi:hypothetical protein B0H19DRAFT_1270408 [Mycena capillaripes]|nr:hypothetical protein B0H19DRAFT_1270408 [Mycena capillaripes]
MKVEIYPIFESRFPLGPCHIRRALRVCDTFDTAPSRLLPYTVDLTFKGLRGHFRPFKNRFSKPTTAAAVTASSLLAKELWDEILDCLAQCPSALLATALVCRAFVGRSQMLLFRSTHIARPPFPVAANQLANILTRSPHLINYIYELWIGRCDAETLAPIVHLPWSRLSAIHFARHHTEERLAVDQITAFVSLPTLHQLSFYSAWDQHDLHTILASCNRGIINVGFWVFDPPTPYDPPLANNSSHLRITHLDLSVGFNIFDFVVHAASPLDLSHLTHLKWNCSAQDPRFYQFLRTASRTIQSLEIWGTVAEHAVVSVDFGSWPALSHITVYSTTALLVKAIACARTLRTIRFVFLPEARGQLPNLEAALLAADMPALQRVELQVFWPSKHRDTSSIAQWKSVIKTKVFRTEAVEEPPDLSRTELMAMVEKKMPQLMERGILHIWIDEPWSWNTHLFREYV